MPPERKIEKILRAYAKKRRATGGDSFALSSATRKRLQEEVAKRVREEEKPEESSLTAWEFFRRQWAFLTTFALAIFLGAALILPVFLGSKAKSRGESALAMKEKVAPMPATASVAKEPAVAPVALTMSDNLTVTKSMPIVTTSSIGGLVNARDLGLTTNVVVYYAPPNADLPALAIARNSATNAITGVYSLQDKTFVAGGVGGGGGVGGVSAGEVAAVNRDREYKKAEVDLVKDEAQKEEAQKPSGQLATPPAASTPAVEFRTAKGSELSSSYQNMAAAAKTSTVLTRFKITQRGSGIQIVDNDGSVYSGSWQPRAAQNTVNRALLNGNNQALDQNAVPAAVPAQNQTAAIVQTAAQTYSVQFSGDNRTLKQKVVFTGDLSVVMAASAVANNGPAANSNIQQNFGYANANGGLNEGAQNLTSNGFIQPSLWLSSYIVGKATIAGTNQLEINAVSVAP